MNNLNNHLPATVPLNVKRNTCVFSIDVEDWFHIMDLKTAPKIADWDRLPSHVEVNFLRMLDMLDAHQTKSTCFFLGWVAQKYPGIVREAAKRGHEIASHGFAHSLIYELQAPAFLEDIHKAKVLLEDISGTAVDGYRAPGFSVTHETPWFFDCLAKSGYSYSSSVFPGGRQHGGYEGFEMNPCIVSTQSGDIREFPIPLANFMSKNVCFFGGGYLRLFPYFLIRQMAKQVLGKQQPVIFYIHPREIEPDHPRLAMPVGRRIKSYIGLKSTAGKIDRLLSEFEFSTFRDLIH